MAEHQRDHRVDEPIPTPSQAEGERRPGDGHPGGPERETPSHAEGDRNTVEQSLRARRPP
jgi:hypothetical protein